MLIKPLDAVLVEFTNDAIHLVDPNRRSASPPTSVFSIVSVLFLRCVIAFITDRMIAPRLGPYASRCDGGDAARTQGSTLSAEESRGLRFALFGLIGLLVVFVSADGAAMGAAAQSARPASSSATRRS